MKLLFTSNLQMHYILYLPLQYYATMTVAGDKDAMMMMNLSDYLQYFWSHLSDIFALYESLSASHQQTEGGSPKEGFTTYQSRGVLLRGLELVR